MGTTHLSSGDLYHQGMSIARSYAVSSYSIRAESRDLWPMANTPAITGTTWKILRNRIRDESVHLCYIDPPFNSKRNLQPDLYQPYRA